MIKSKTVTWEGTTSLLWGKINAFKIFVRKGEGTLSITILGLSVEIILKYI